MEELKATKEITGISKMAGPKVINENAQVKGLRKITSMPKIFTSAGL